VAIKNKYKALRGMPDILPDKARLMRIVEEKIKKLFVASAFSEIRTPVLEETEVFTRSIGEDTDIVEKEMYSFFDRSGKNVSMRPEGTAAVIRAYIENGWAHNADITKVFYYGPMFRGERPQKGRLRQFYQAGVEIIGDSSSYIDAEVITTLDNLLKVFEVKDYTILINSLGCYKDRRKYKKLLLEYLETKKSSLCDNCKKRIETNVLRVLDCKNKACKIVLKNAPSVKDSLCGECSEKFNLVKSLLNAVKIPFKEKIDLVRGLDYYTGVVFEVVSGALGSQDAIAAGGRYDNLCREMGGPDVGATGFAVGIERLLMVMNRDKYKENRKKGAFVVLMDKDMVEYGFKMLNRLRGEGISSEWDPAGRSFKAQMRKANRQKWSHVIVIGEDEIKTGEISLKDMDSGKQIRLASEDIIEKLKNEREK
jgi:histidyl-tRNA synthetase